MPSGVCVCVRGGGGGVLSLEKGTDYMARLLQSRGCRELKLLNSRGCLVIMNAQGALKSVYIRMSRQIKTECIQISSNNK